MNGIHNIVICLWFPDTAILLGYILQTVMLQISSIQGIIYPKVRAGIFILLIMIEKAFQIAPYLRIDKDATKIGITIDTVYRRVGIKIDDRDIQNDHFPCLRVITPMNEKALVLIPEIIAKYAFHPGPFLFDHQLGQVVIVYAGHVHIGPAVPGTRGGLC